MQAKVCRQQAIDYSPQYTHNTAPLHRIFNTSFSFSTFKVTLAWHGSARPGTAWHGIEWEGKARHGMPWHARHGTCNSYALHQSHFTYPRTTTDATSRHTCEYSVCTCVPAKHSLSASTAADTDAEAHDIGLGLLVLVDRVQRRWPPASVAAEFAEAKPSPCPSSPTEFSMPTTLRHSVWVSSRQTHERLQAAKLGEERQSERV